MKVLNFQEKLAEERKTAMDECMKSIKDSTQFLVVYSDDNMCNIKSYNYRITNLEAIGALDILKHNYLERVYQDEDGPDDDDKEDVPCEGGL